MLDRDYDVIVVGARIAGATVAALLGDAGHRVLLADRGSFPSPTLSTHFFRGAGLVAVLDRLGVLAQVRALGSPPLVRTYLYAGGVAEPIVGPLQDPGNAGYCLSVRRESLDDLLIRRATASTTVEFADRTRFLGLLHERDRVVGARLATPEGEQSVRARIVVGADGRQSAIARAVGAAVEEGHPPIRALYYRYVRGFGAPEGAEPDGAEFSFLGDELAYVFPSDDGVTCIALSVNLSDFARARGAVADYFHSRVQAHRGLAGRFMAATPEGKQLGCGPEPNVVRVPAGPGWALVGDAGLHQDPWTGRGMDMAGTHATFLAEALLDLLGGNVGERQALADYHARRNDHGLPYYRETVAHGKDLRQLAAS